KQLCQEVGDRRAANPEHVAHRSVGCVTETGILDGPGGEREAKRGCKQYQGCASKLAQSPVQRIAQRIGQKAQAVQAAIDDCHVCWLIQSRHKPVECFRRGISILHHGYADVASARACSVSLIAREVSPWHYP